MGSLNQPEQTMPKIRLDATPEHSLYSTDIKAYRRERMRRLRSCPEFKKKSNAKAREWQLANPIHFSWTNSRKSAQVRGYAWSITREEHKALVCADCSYCGAAPSPVNGIDRVDNGNGYDRTNVVTACEHCNYAKRKMRRFDFIEWAKRVVAHSRE